MFYNVLKSEIEILNDHNSSFALVRIKKEDAANFLVLLSAIEYGRVSRFFLKSSQYSLEFGTDRKFCLTGGGDGKIMEGEFAENEIDIIKCCCIDSVQNAYSDPHVDIERPLCDITISITG